MSSEETNNTPANPSSNSNNVSVSILPDIISPITPILKEIYTDLASPAVKKVGMALETVMDFGYTMIFAPLQNVSEKRKLNLQKNMDQYKKKIETIDEHEIAQVPPELGVPILQKLTYIQNDDLVDLFTTLLASASSVKTCSLAHPGFINIINNLTPDEAKILKYLSDNEIENLPFIIIQLQMQVHEKQGNEEFTSRLTGFDRMEELNLLFPQNDHLYFDNFMGLGLLDIPGTAYLSDEQKYKNLENTYQDMVEDIERIKDERVPSARINIKKGYYKRTFYADSFFKACITRLQDKNQ
ncbi:DUF4393 domain-containing protein [Mesobacillus maritimus]|uniref:DUF4393 domain-containing protein n=1 Tax=Mesobacillus maritimus TaxID=1643336 RepID=UPI00384F17A0